MPTCRPAFIASYWHYAASATSSPPPLHAGAVVYYAERHAACQFTPCRQLFGLRLHFGMPRADVICCRDMMILFISCLYYADACAVYVFIITAAAIIIDCHMHTPFRRQELRRAQPLRGAMLMPSMLTERAMIYTPFIVFLRHFIDDACFARARSVYATRPLYARPVALLMMPSHRRYFT